MFELNSHDGWKTGYATFFWQNPKKIEKNMFTPFFCKPQKKSKILSRKSAGISRKFAGISRKFADRIFDNFQSNIFSLCGHGPSFSRTMSFASSKNSTETLGRGLKLLDRSMTAMVGVKPELHDEEEARLEAEIQDPNAEKALFGLYSLNGPNFWNNPMLLLFYWCRAVLATKIS